MIVLIGMEDGASNSSGLGMCILFLAIFIAICVYFVLKDVKKTKEKNEKASQLYSLSYKYNKEGYRLLQISQKEYFGIDERNKKWILFNIYKPRTYQYSDMTGYDIIENGASVTNGVISGRSGSVVVGGMLFGALGALAGAAGKRKTSSTTDEMCTNLSIYIYINNVNNPVEKINIIESSISKNSEEYKTAIDILQRLYAYLNIIQIDNEKSE